MSKKKKNTAPEIQKNADLENNDLEALENNEPVGDDNAELSESGDNYENTEQPIKKKRAKKAARRVNVRSLKHGSLSVTFTVIFIAAVVLVNVIASIVSERFGAAADLTGGGLYTLDETTQNYLDNSLSSDVKITVLSSEQVFEQNAATRQVSEILKRMEIENGNITLDYLDLDQNPNYVSRFTGEELDTDYIVIESERTGRHRVITPTDYFGLTTEELQYYYAYYGYVTQYLIEQEAVGAMMFVTDEDPVRVAFTEGYGETDHSALEDLLEKNGYSVEKIDLLSAEDIDPDIDFVIVHAPSIDIGNEQLAKLDKFLDNNGRYGKNVIYFAGISQPKTPNIDSFLSDWSLSVGFYDVGQMNSSYLISPFTPYAHRLQICDTSYTSELYGSRLYTLGADMRPVFVENGGSADTSVLLKTYDDAFLYPLDLENEDEFDINSAQSGAFNEVAAGVKTSSDGAVSRVIAVGSDTFSGSYFMSYTNGNNSDFFVNMFNVISRRTAGVVIQAKLPIDLSFEMNAKAANTLAVALCIVIPVCIIAVGIAVWLRRRHR